MAKAPVKPLPDQSTVARYVGYSKLRRDKHGEAIGVLHTAFSLRPNEATLSAAHLDHFNGTRIGKLSALKVAYDPHPLVVKPNGAFTLGNVAEIKDTCETYGRTIRIVNAPSKHLDCYVEVRQFKDDVVDLLAILADDTWSDFTIVRDIP